MRDGRTSAPIPPDVALMSPAEISSFDHADVVVLLPTLNEEEGLARTLSEIPLQAVRSHGWTVRTLVIDGPSTDGTRAVAKSHGVPVLLQQTRGKGAAIRQALTWLAGHQVRYVIVLDADCTYPGAMVPAFAQLLDAGSQLVVGVRQPERPANADGRELVHRIGNRLLNMTASQLSGLPILDLCSGFWGVRLDAVAALGLETDGFEIESELFSKSYRAGYNVSQIPIQYRERVGVAKLRALHDGARILLTTVRFGRRKFDPSIAPARPLAVRDLLSVAIAQQGTDIQVLFDPSRRAEAAQIAGRLRAAATGGRVSVQPALSVEAAASANLPADAQPVTITLPPRAERSEPSAPYAIIDLPKTRRVVALSPGADAPLDRSGGFAGDRALRLEYAPFRWPIVNRMRALAANTFPSGASKELAFLGANAHFGELAVWRRPEPADPASSSGPGLPPEAVSRDRVL